MRPLVSKAVRGGARTSTVLLVLYEYPFYKIQDEWRTIAALNQRIARHYGQREALSWLCGSSVHSHTLTPSSGPLGPPSHKRGLDSKATDPCQHMHMPRAPRTRHIPYQSAYRAGLPPRSVNETAASARNHTHASHAIASGYGQVHAELHVVGRRSPRIHHTLNDKT